MLFNREYSTPQYMPEFFKSVPAWLDVQSLQLLLQFSLAIALPVFFHLIFYDHFLLQLLVDILFLIICCIKKNNKDQKNKVFTLIIHFF